MLTPAAIENIQKDEGDIRRAVLELVREDAEVIDQLKGSELLMEVLADRPELVEEVLTLAEEIGG